MQAGAAATVLIVDHEDLVRKIGVDILQDGGFRVLEAANAAEALSCLSHDADVMVLFTDVNMPGTPDGLGLAKVVHDRWPSIKILVASGQMRPGPRDLPEMGLFLSKPYRAEDLLRLVQTLIAS